MDEQRAWLRPRRKKRLRILTAILSFCVLLYLAGGRYSGNFVYCGSHLTSGKGEKTKRIT